jgi:DNA replication protein DnaC
MSSQTYDEVIKLMTSLKLPTMKDQLDHCLRAADASELSHLEFLKTILIAEQKGRDESGFRRRLQSAHIPVPKTVEAFDFSFQTSIKKARIINLADCRWLGGAVNLLFEGPPGVGKTHLAIALALKALEKGYRVRFFAAQDLMQDMYVQAAAGQLNRFVMRLLQNELLVIDEFAYLPLDAHAGNCLYQIVSQAYEKVSLVITSNKSVDAWGDMFQDQSITRSILDRFLHHCEVFKMKGDSYRLKGPKKTDASSAPQGPQGSCKPAGEDT